MAIPGSACINAGRVGRQRRTAACFSAAISQRNKRARLRSRFELFVTCCHRLSPYRYSGETKLIVEAARIRLASAAADPRGSARAARALLRKAVRARRKPPARMSTDRLSAASPQSADTTARCARRRSRPAAPVPPARPESTISATPWPGIEAQTGRIGAQAAPRSMIAKSWAPEPRRPSCARRFVVIYRRREPEGHGRHGRILVNVMIFPVSQTLRQSHHAAAWR